MNANKPKTKQTVEQHEQYPYPKDFMRNTPSAMVDAFRGLQKERADTKRESCCTKMQNYFFNKLKGNLDVNLNVGSMKRPDINIGTNFEPIKGPNINLENPLNMAAEFNLNKPEISINNPFGKLGFDGPNATLTAVSENTNKTTSKTRSNKTDADTANRNIMEINRNTKNYDSAFKAFGHIQNLNNVVTIQDTLHNNQDTGGVHKWVADKRQQTNEAFQYLSHRSTDLDEVKQGNLTPQVQETINQLHRYSFANPQFVLRTIKHGTQNKLDYQKEYKQQRQNRKNLNNKLI